MRITMISMLQMREVFFSIIFNTKYLFVQAQNLPVDLNDPILCQNQKSCGECMNVSVICRWCSKPIFGQRRCNIESYLLIQGCESSFLINYPSRVELGRSKNMEYYHISNRNASIYLRPMEKIEFDIDFTLNKLLPIELGILMHFSTKFSPWFERIIDLTKDIANTGMSKGIEKIGLAKFLDKVSHPIINITQYDKNYNKTTNPINYAIISPLTSNSSEIIDSWRDYNLFNNSDYMEAILDGIVQTVQCYHMDWKPGNEVIKIILATTNDLPKFQGIGKIVGLIKPHSLDCDINDNKIDEYGMRYDYPSVGQTGFVLEDNNMQIIFLVTANVKPYYQEMIKVWKNVKASIIDFDFQNQDIINHIIQSREDLKKSLKVSTTDQFDIVLNITALCQNADKNICYDIELKKQNRFHFEIQITRYIEKKMEISINFDRFEKFKLSYERIQTCNCSEEKILLQCNGNGNLSCGKCICENNFGGEDCSCNKTSINYVTACKHPQTYITCSNRGTCNDCGKCLCYTAPDGLPYDGELCECSRKNCEYFENEICGGSTRGKCKCNSCVCNYNFTGSACEIPKCNDTQAENLCIQPGSNESCSGIGPCKCGVCDCPLNKDGNFCEKDKINIACEYFEKAVYCISENKENDESLCNSDDIEIIKIESESYKCLRIDNMNCRIYYNYNFNNQTAKYEVLLKPIDQKSDCVKPINIALVTILSFVGVLFVGCIIILIYLLVLYLYVRAEFKKFESDIQKEVATQANPIFKNQ